jgi:hypothetical protein
MTDPIEAPGSLDLDFSQVADGLFVFAVECIRARDYGTGGIW